MSCHRYLGENPLIFSVWVREHLGEVRAQEIILLSNTVKKYTKADKKEMFGHYSAELEAMQKKRLEGKKGSLDFNGYD